MKSLSRLVVSIQSTGPCGALRGLIKAHGRLDVVLPSTGRDEFGSALAADAHAMNALAMNARNVTYVLEIHQLARPYRTADSLQNATRL